MADPLYNSSASAATTSSDWYETGTAATADTNYIEMVYDPDTASYVEVQEYTVVTTEHTFDPTLLDVVEGKDLYDKWEEDNKIEKWKWKMKSMERPNRYSSPFVKKKSYYKAMPRRRQRW